MPTVRLQSSDGELFPVDAEITKGSVTIQGLLQDQGNEDEYDKVVVLPDVTGAILRKVIDYLMYHKDDVPMTDVHHVDDSENISAWDEDFLKVDKDTLFELLRAAHYLDIEKLVDVSSQAVANMLTGKNSQEMGDILGIPNSASDEHGQIDKENEWCKET